MPPASDRARSAVKKPDSLRAAIAAILPEFAADPARLAMFVEKGRIRAPQTRQRGFMWSYDLTVIATAFTHDPDVLMFVVVDWLRRYQPDLLAANSAAGFTFEADILDDRSWDVQIVLPLDEAVRASQAPDGGWLLEAVEEPATLFPDDVPLRPNEGPLLSIWHQGTRIAPPDPA